MEADLVANVADLVALDLGTLTSLEVGGRMRIITPVEFAAIIGRT